MLNRLTTWKENREGNVAIILAIAIIPILALIGIAIDLQNTNRSRQFVQYSLDNAVIAGSRAMQSGKSKAEINAYINDFVDGVLKAKNYSASCKPVEVTYSKGSQDINATIKCQQETTLTELIGYQYLDFTVTSGSTYGIGNVDVAMVFDVSGSMGWSGKMSALKDAAQDAVDILLPTGATADMGDVRISMVSYSYMMDAGPFFRKVTNEYPVRTYTEKYCKRYRRGECRKWKTQTKTVNSTCVIERTGSEAFTDADPGPNAWIKPALDSATADRPTCNPIPPLPLTDNRSALKNYINNLYPNGGTAGHIGIAWGWYTIAPNWSIVWPAASNPLGYKEPDSAKAMIVMTDGEFNQEYNYSEGNGDSFAQAKILCDKVKDEGVRIYTVAFQAPKAGQKVLEYCASGTEFAFKADSANELKDAYAKIATSISDLRITY